MFNGLGADLSNLSRMSNAKTRSISPENFKGEKGKGGMAEKGTGEWAARDLGKGWKVSPSIKIEPKELVEIANIQESGAINHIWLTPTGNWRDVIVRMYWDGSEKPSVECPIGDFFANAYKQPFTQLSSLPICVNPHNGFNCYWEMPFRKGCRITVENRSDDDVYLYYQIDYVLTEIPDDCAYFHAQFRRINPLPYKEVYTIVDNIEGKGQYVGTYMAWQVNNTGWWGEGEIKFYMDDDTDYPTICGTGTEDYFCGAYNFDVEGQYREFCTPYSGLAKVVRPDGTYNSQQRFSMYRWHITDPIRFEKNLKVNIQALGWRSGGRYLPLQDDISSVAFWYQDKPAQNFPELPGRDEMEII